MREVFSVEIKNRAGVDHLSGNLIDFAILEHLVLLQVVVVVRAASETCRDHAEGRFCALLPRRAHLQVTAEVISQKVRCAKAYPNAFNIALVRAFELKGFELL